MVIWTILISSPPQNLRGYIADSSSPRGTELGENKFFCPYSINRNSRLENSEDCWPAGDRHTANGSCLDDRRRKAKMQVENKNSLFKQLGNTLCFPSLPSWAGRQQRDKRSGGSIQSCTPCLLPGDLLGCMPPGRMPETGDTEDMVPSPRRCQGLP